MRADDVRDPCYRSRGANAIWQPAWLADRFAILSQLRAFNEVGFLANRTGPIEAAQGWEPCR